jgi:hypothetical protein
MSLRTWATRMLPEGDWLAHRWNCMMYDFVSIAADQADIVTQLVARARGSQVSALL